MIQQAAVTEPEYVDPLTFNKISSGDRVKVIAPSGVVIDLEVYTIEIDGFLTLGPLNKKMEKQTVVTSNTIVLATRFSNKQSGFSTQLKDFVTVLDKSGHKLKMKVDTIVGDEFLLLMVPGGTKDIGLWNKLKFFWKMAGR